MRSKLVLAARACLSLSSVASAQVYKWVDDQGKIHYGDRPPGQQPVSNVAVPKARPVPSAAATNQGRYTEPSASSPSASSPASQRTTPQQAKQTVDPAQKAISDCKANRGVDCGKPDGARQWESQNTPATKEQIKQQQEAGAARSRRKMEEDLNRAMRR